MKNRIEIQTDVEASECAKRIIAWLNGNGSKAIAVGSNGITFRGGLSRAPAAILSGEMYVNKSNDGIEVGLCFQGWRFAVYGCWPAYLMLVVGGFYFYGDITFYAFVLVSWACFYFLGGWMHRRAFVYWLREQLEGM